MKKNNLIAAVTASVVVLVIGSIILVAYQSKKSTTDTSNSSNTTSTTTVAQTQNANEVTISNYAFSPALLKVKKGTTVKWTNKDQASHTVTGDIGSPASQLLSTNSSYSYTFDTIGTFAYHCQPHPYMQATVEVSE